MSTTGSDHIENAQSAINNALTAGDWQNADQVYAVLSLTHAVLAVAAILGDISDTLTAQGARRDYHA